MCSVVIRVGLRGDWFFGGDGCGVIRERCGDMIGDRVFV